MQVDIVAYKNIKNDKSTNTTAYLLMLQFAFREFEGTDKGI